MKYTLKKSLAVLLAALMLLGTMAVGAAAAEKPGSTQSGHSAAWADNPIAEGCTMTISSPGTAEADLYWYDAKKLYVSQWNLSGLVIDVSGGKLPSAQTVAYDAVSTGQLQSGNISWDIFVTWPEEGWVFGENKVLLHADAMRYSDFRVIETIGGVEFGVYDTQEVVFCCEIPFTVTGVEDITESAPDFQSAEELLLGEPKPVSIPRLMGYARGTERKLFRFTPDASGSYCFRSKGAHDSMELYTEDGRSAHYSPGVDPWGVLFGEDGSRLAYNEDNRGSDDHRFNFGIYYALEAGKTYYLQTSARYGGDYTVQADTYDANEKKLAAPQKEVTIQYGGYISMEDLLAGTTWDIRQLEVKQHGKSVLEHDTEWEETTGRYTRGFTGYKPGTETLVITAPDGEEVEIKVTVKHTFWSWIKYYLLGDWIYILIAGEMPGSIWHKPGLALKILLYPFFIIFALPMELIMWLFELGNGC